MAQPVVSTCVQSILASFMSAIHVLQKIGRTGKKPSRRSKSTEIDETGAQEGRLLASLNKGPASIESRYHQNIKAVGARFAAGDAIANTALTDVLLKLNAGLVAIIDQFLRREDVVIDVNRLTQTSEQAREDTCYVLNQLLCRLQQPSFSKDLQSTSPVIPGSDANKRKKRQHKSANGKRLSRRPVLAKVFIAGSSTDAQIAMVKPVQRNKQKKPRASSKLKPNLHSSESSLPLSQPMRHMPSSKHELISPRRKGSALELGLSRTAPETIGVQARSSTPRHTFTGVEQDSPIICPPSLDIRRRKQTPTYHSIESNSTKLGEIPLHKWHELPDFEALSLQDKEAARNGWPLGDDQTEPQRKKGKSGFSRLFRRRRQT